MCLILFKIEQLQAVQLFNNCSDLQKLKERLDEGPVLQASPATRAPASDDPRNHTRPRGLGRGCGPFWLPDEFFEDLDLIGTPANPYTPPRQS